MVGNDTDGYIVLCVLTVGLARNGADGVEYLSDGVHLKEVVHALHNAGKTLKTHTGIDILLHELGVIAVAVIVELREDVVPDLHKAVTVTAGLAVGRAAAVFDSAVKVDLRAGAAGTLTVLPEVVSLTKSYNVLLGHADDVAPDGVCLVVLFVYARPQKVCGDLKHVVQEFPGEGNCLVFKVITKGEVAEHLKVGAVARGVSYALKVGRADALLAGRNAAARGLLFSRKEFFHGCHSRVDQKQGLVAVWHEREAGKTKMSLAFEEGKVFFTQIV